MDECKPLPCTCARMCRAVTLPRGPARCCSPRHRMPSDALDEDSNVLEDEVEEEEEVEERRKG